MRGFGGSYFYQSPNNFARAVTFAGEITASEHINLAVEKKLKLGTTGAAVFMSASGQTTPHLAVSLPTGNIVVVKDKDREAVDMGAMGAAAGHPAVVVAADAASANYGLVKQDGSTTIVRGVSGAMDVYAGGNLRLTGSDVLAVTVTSGTKVTMNLPIALKKYATGSLPAFVEGDLTFDDTTNKAQIGGAAAWEVITSA